MYDALQFIAARRGSLGFMILKQAEAGTDDFGFIVEAAAGNKTIDQCLEVGRNHFAHGARTQFSFSGPLRSGKHLE